MDIDSCLDSGGAWNYIKGECSKTPTKESVVFQFQIHPNLPEQACSSLPNNKSISEENEFPKLIKNGWVELLRSDYKNGREFYPCIQDIVVIFPSKNEFLEFLSKAGSSPQYPFYSAADFNLMTSIFEAVAQSGDPMAYDLLLTKDTRNSASEMDAPLYSTLRNNPSAYLEAFQKLSNAQKKIAVRTQYDFNEPINKQLFDIKSLGTNDVNLRSAAEQFNKLMKTQNGS